MATATNPPPYFITADDKRGLIVVTAAIVLAFVWTCSLIRTWLRWQARDYKADDCWLALATLVYTVQSSVIFHLVNLGWGSLHENLPLSQLERIGKGETASQVFYICTLLFSKYSVLFLYLRLSPVGVHRVTSYAVVAASFIWAVLAIILTVVPCNPVQYFTSPQECTNRWPKWQAISSLDIVTEACIFGIAVQIVWVLHMNLKAKLFIIFAFSSRLPIIAIAALRLYYLHNHFLDTKLAAEYIVATQWQMGYSIMSSTFTSMGPFLRPFDQAMHTTSNYKTSHYGNHSAHVPEKTRNKSILSQPQRSSWQSEGYLMQSIPSRRGSKNTLSDSCTLDNSSANQIASASTTTTHLQAYSRTAQSPTRLITDTESRPFDDVSGNHTSIWVGDRASSFRAADGIPTSLQDGGAMVINKKTRVDIEVDGATSVI